MEHRIETADFTALNEATSVTIYECVRHKLDFHDLAKLVLKPAETGERLFG